MRGVAAIGVTVAAILAAAGNLWAAEAVHYYSLINASAARVDFADEKGQMGKAGFVSFSILTVLPAGPVAYSMSRVSLSCAGAQIATLENANYAANGAPLPSDTVDPAPQPITKGTLGQSLRDVVCNGLDPYPRSKAIKGVADTVTRAHELMAALKEPAAK